MKYSKSTSSIITFILILLLSNLYVAQGIKKSIRETRKLDYASFLLMNDGLDKATLSVSENASIAYPDWLNGKGAYISVPVTKSYADIFEFQIKMIGDGSLRVHLASGNKHAIVDYKNLVVNGKTIFSHLKKASDNKPVVRAFPVKNGDVVSMSVQVRKHHFKASDFRNNFWTTLVICLFALFVFIHKKTCQNICVENKIKEKKERLIFLDIIRIFACLCVLIIHFNASVSGYDIFGKFVYPNHLIPNNYFGVYLGRIGVGIFFILSGACLQHVYGVVNLDLSNILSFFKKRAMSLYPVFWTTFAFFTMYSFLTNKGIPPVKLGHWIESLLGMDGYFMCMGWGGSENYQCGEWFLGCILFLYLIYPIVSYYANRFPKMTTLVVLVIYFSTVRIVNSKWFFLQIPYLLLGIFFIKYLKTVMSWKIWIPTLVASVIKFVFSSKLSPSTNTIILDWLVFLSFVWAIEIFNKYSDFLKKENVVKSVNYVSVLTYPLFLTHHKIIAVLAKDFDLVHFPYHYTVMCFICYMIITVYLSVYFMNLTKKIRCFFKGAR